MNFDAISNLQEGNYDFVLKLNSYLRNDLVLQIRNHEKRLEIISDFLPNLKKQCPEFCFDIIYDLEEFKEDNQDLLTNYIDYKHLSLKQISDILFTTSWVQFFIINYLTDIIAEQNPNTLEMVFRFLMQDISKNQDLITYFAFKESGNLRYLFIDYILKNDPLKIEEIYEDFTVYLQPESSIKMEDLCTLAVNVLCSPLKKQYFLKIKKIILTNYPKNKLASKLLEKEINDLAIAEFKNDANNLFLTSSDYQFQIFKNYSQWLSQDILNKFLKTISFFQRNNVYDGALENIYKYDLGQKLEEYVDKYLSLSQSQIVEPLQIGSTASPYRLGDYVIKLVNLKWSYEKIICPDLYLILKNLEEDYIRNKKGYVLAGLEVQPYLQRSAKEVPEYVLTNFRQELEKNGYLLSDTLVGGVNGDNCLLLNSYQEANCNNEQELPVWFKEYPMVLVDRDLIFNVNNSFQKKRSAMMNS